MRVCLLGLVALLISFTVVFADLEPEKYVDGVLLVRFNQDIKLEVRSDQTVVSGVEKLDKLLEEYEAYDIKDFFGGYIIQDDKYRHETRNDHKIIFPSHYNMYEVASAFENLKVVEFADPDYCFRTFYTPNDPSFGIQYWLSIIDAPQAWDIETGNESVILAIIDSGIDWNHPDLIDNVWVNPGEDLDGVMDPCDPNFDDIPGTLNDWNSIDDDNNGLVDDFIGWDWYDGQGVADGEDPGPPDNNPMDFNGHGTGVNSAAAGSGDNGIGGASVAYNCQIMALRCGYTPPEGTGLIVMSCAISGLAYAVDNNAKVVNMSYGGYQASNFMNNSISNAWDNGLLMFAAAGNDNVSNLSYPANYDNVISVAATNRNDQRAYFSNYGNWVDIAAPGTDCYTAWFNNTYTSWQGTSVACPIAAGLGALVASAYPEMTNEDWAEIIIDSTDPLITDQPIGSGRINAYNALTQVDRPELVFDDWNVSDVDGNGHPDLNEEIFVTFQVTNQPGWSDATEAIARIDLSVEGITYGRQTLELGTIPSGNQVVNTNLPLSFTLTDESMNGTPATLTLSISCGPGEYTQAVSQTVMLGTADFILVDDDNSNLDEFISSDLNQGSFNYFRHDTSVLDAVPTGESLSDYKAIIWMTGDSDTPLDQDEIASLQDAIDNGTHVFLFGQTLDEQLDGSDFYQNYLHVSSSDARVAQPALNAIEGVGLPVIENSTIILAGPGGAGNSTDPDVIIPLEGANAGYHYLNSENVGMVFVESTAKIVYFPFAFEACSGGANTATRTDIINAIFSWFEVLEVDPVENNNLQPVEFAIASVYPNPFNPSTTISLDIKNRSQVSLKVFDLLGREVANLYQGQLSTGNHPFIWKAENLAAGIYFASFETPEFRQVEKLVLVK